MRLPTPGEPPQGSSRWEVIRYALGSNARTIRFCSICLVMTGSPITVLVELLRHFRLPASLAVAIMVAPTYDISGVEEHRRVCVKNVGLLDHGWSEPRSVEQA
jgi:hypothetical protein